MSNEGKKTIKLDLELCYSGFNVEELQYIDYTRTTAELEDVENSSRKRDEDMLSEDEDEIFAGIDYEELRSYLCSTPTAIGRTHRGNFSQDMSGLNDPEFLAHYDSGTHTQNVSTDSLASLCDDVKSIAGSTESLYETDRSRMRRKIELDSDIHDPYSKIDELDSSLEEGMSLNNNTRGLGSLRRRLSIKILQRNTSTGLFGSYVQRNQSPAEEMTSVPSSDQVPLTSKSQGGRGPLNLWFRKFRNRHFI